MSETPRKPVSERGRRATATGPPRVRRSRGRPKREDHKVGAEELILRTCDLLRIMPPHQITIAAVARQAGVNPALIRYYFRDRSLLMLAVARHLLHETAPLHEPITTPESAQRAVRSMLRALIGVHREYPSFRELFFEDIMNQPSPEARELFCEAVIGGVARARTMLALLRGEPADAENPNLEPALLHVALIGMAEFFVSAFKIIETGAGAPLDRDRVDEHFVDFVADMLLHGLRKSR